MKSLPGIFASKIEHQVAFCVKRSEMCSALIRLLEIVG